MIIQQDPKKNPNAHGESGHGSRPGLPATNPFPSFPGLPPVPGNSGVVGPGGAGGAGGAGGSGGTGTGSGGSSMPGLPPELTQLNITGSAPSELTGLASDYQKQLGAVEAGRSREANVFNENLASDMERQIASAKEQAAREGRPFDEAAMRAELTRGGNASKAEFALGTQKEALASTRAGLDIAKAPFEAEMAAKGLSLETQKLLANYALGRGGLANDANANAVKAEALRQGQALDYYKAMLEAMRMMAS